MNGKTILEDYNNQSADINDFVTLTEMIDFALERQRIACAKAAYPFITADGEVYTKILNASIEE